MMNILKAMVGVVLTAFAIATGVEV